MSTFKLTPQERARESGRTMIENDNTFRELGAQLELIDKGTARVRLKITKSHTNGHGFCHSGIMITLADSTFGLAYNSYNVKAVAQSCNITYISPVKETDILIAEAKELKNFERSAIYDVKIKNQDKNLIAVFRGHSREISSSIFQEN